MVLMNGRGDAPCGRSCFQSNAGLRRLVLRRGLETSPAAVLGQAGSANAHGPRMPAGAGPLPPPASQLGRIFSAGSRGVGPSFFIALFITSSSPIWLADKSGRLLDCGILDRASSCLWHVAFTAACGCGLGFMPSALERRGLAPLPDLSNLGVTLESRSRS
jgi:hypothetical protein